MQTLRDIAIYLTSHDDLRNLILTFVFGSILSLFVSLLNDERRSAKQLLAGSFLGGVAAGVAFRVMHFRWGWEIVVVIAAYGGDQLALGIKRIARDFSKSPFSTVQRWFALISAIGETIRNFKFNGGGGASEPPIDQDLPPDAPD